ncbi:hypothetical protein [Flavicella sp.]|uniref:hypothetical protein n=1 Tax=Flavicella sp. TaxID=2957742 RepID=UPI00260C1116|nr:hypothetical protein [Flavicella sp.]MDG1804844.1 hypothetical protein [Flavicella sp.]
MKTKIFTLVLALISFSGFPQQIEVLKKDNSIEKVSYDSYTIGSRSIKLNSKEKLAYEDVKKISTDFFDAYERAMKKLGKEKYKHIEIEFTGDENIYALQLEKLQSKRLGIETTRAAGGLLTLIGVLSGDRQLTSAGLLTSYIGDTNSMENNQKSIAVQTEMLKDLDERTKANTEEKTEKEILEATYGKENVAPIETLLNRNYKKAEALATVGELSENKDYQLAAVWVKALIAKEQGNTQKVSEEYQRLLALETNLTSEKELEKEIQILLKELNSLRA